MAISESGEKDRLTITACTVDDSGNITVVSGTDYPLTLNPSEYDHSYAIAYNKKGALGQSGAGAKFSGAEPETLKFSFLIDGTGVVMDVNNGVIDVEAHIKTIHNLVYQYDGENHEPNYVRVLWGTQIFFGRLDTMSVDSTLFKPSGVPLRARIKLEFSGFMSKEEEALRANRSSPDLSHLIEVQAGDTLPLLCYRIYKDSAYYPDVARINRLSNFRDIAPGLMLHFPPLS